MHRAEAATLSRAKASPGLPLLAWIHVKCLVRRTLRQGQLVKRRWGGCQQALALLGRKTGWNADWQDAFVDLHEVHWAMQTAAMHHMHNNDTIGGQTHIISVLAMLNRQCLGRVVRRDLGDQYPSTTCDSSC